jgi:NADH-quinone oxidoreductase subunit M
MVLMFGHGVVSGGLFFIVGILYDRFRTKLISYYSGIFQCMPLLSVFFFLLILGNISLPGTSNFIGEFLVFYSSFFFMNLFALLSIAVSILFCSFYSLYLYNRVVFGFVNQIKLFKDINILEFSVLCPLIFFMFFIGIYPSPFFDVITMSCSYLSFIN